MVKWCYTLGVILVGIGVIETIYIWANGAFLLGVISLISCIINAVVYFAVAELDERLQNVERYKVLEKTSPVKDTDMKSYVYNTIRDRNMVDAGGWRCPKCGKVNASYVGTCGCGAQKEK